MRSRRIGTGGAIGLFAAVILAAPAPAQNEDHTPLWAGTGGFYVGVNKAGQRADVNLSADGRRIAGLVLTYPLKCNAPPLKGLKRPNKGTMNLTLYGAPVLVRKGGFAKRMRFAGYSGQYSSASMSGRVIGGGAAIVIAFRYRSHLNPGSCDSGTQRYTARRWTPAPWSGTTSQGLPISFDVGALAAQKRSDLGPGFIAPITHLRVTARLTCDNGQTIQTTYDSGAAAAGGFFWHATDIPGVEPAGLAGFPSKEGDPNLSAKSDKSLLELNGTIDQLYSSVPGPVDPETGRPELIGCQAPELKFAAHP